MKQETSIKREIKDVFYLIALQGLNYIAPLLVLPYLMKTLGADKFGYIGFSLSVIQYLMLIVDFGFNLSATKRIALVKDDKEELNKVFTSTVYAKVCLLIISFVILLVVAQIPKFSIYKETMYIMFLMVIGNAFSFVWFFQGIGQIRKVSIINMVAKLTILPLTFLFVKSSQDYLIAAFLQSSVFVFGTIITCFIIWKSKLVSFSTYLLKNVLFELKESYPIFLSSAATSIYTASFALVLGYFGTSADVGKYSAVDRIMRALCYLVLMPVLQAFYPKVVHLSDGNRVHAVKLVKQLFFFVVGCMFIVFLGMYFLSPYVISYLGKDYLSTESLFKIMAFVPIFVGGGGVFAQLGLLALGDEKDKQKYKLVYFIAGLTALLSIFLFIPSFLALGASISLLITEMVVFILMTFFLLKSNSFKIV